MKIVFVPLIMAALWPSFLSSQSNKLRLDSLSRAYAEKNVQGVILVARGDEVIYENAWGLADMDAKIPLRTNSLFKTESTGKMFTATAIMQLVESGRLDLQQTIAEILPELKVSNAEKITLAHLLMHRSGLTSPWNSSEFKLQQAYSKAELQRFIEQQPLAFEEPGERMFYSNSGYVILGWIVEQLSGLAFDSYLTEHLFVPAGMKAIGHLNDSLMPKGEAQPYQFLNSKKYVTRNQFLTPLAHGAGGWVASANDLYRFMRGLDQNFFLENHTLRTMLTANNFKDPREGLRAAAYGFEVYNNQPLEGITYFGHSGGGGGFSIDAILEPENHLIVIFCSNTFMNARAVTANYLRLMHERPLAPIEKPVSIRLYDEIDSKGIQAFLQNSEQYFDRLAIDTNEKIFVRLADAMELAKDYERLLQWAEFGLSRYPDSGILHLFKATAHWHTNQPSEAKAAMEKARILAMSKDDRQLLDEIDRRLTRLERL